LASITEFNQTNHDNQSVTATCMSESLAGFHGTYNGGIDLILPVPENLFMCFVYL